MRRIHAGQLDRRVTIEKVKDDAPTNTHGEINYSDPNTYEAVGERWCRVETGGGSERFSQGQMQAGLTHRVVMRCDSLTKEIKPTYRLLLGDRYFGVISAANVNERGDWIELGCIEAVL